MHFSRLRMASAATLAALVGALFIYNGHPVRGSDHQDSPATMGRPGADITDTYLFPSSDPNNVVVVMDVHPLIPTGQSSTVSFDPGVLYQMKFGSAGASPSDDLVVQFRATGAGASQKITVYGPSAPKMHGAKSDTLSEKEGSGVINTTFKTKNYMTVYAGPREDPFFFDLAQFLKILPDRKAGSTDASCLTTKECSGFNNPGHDTLEGFNVLSLIVEMPRTMLSKTLGSKIAYWATTSVAEGNYSKSWVQLDRLARPAVNEVFATYARHDVNNRDNPADDKNELGNDIQNFMTTVAGRSQPTIDVVKAVLVPDVMIADLSQAGPAAYLGVETGGATGGKFGGRKLQDDIVKTSLGVIFGNTISALKLAPDDGKEVAALTDDHVDATDKHFTSTWPYLGAPR